MDEYVCPKIASFTIRGPLFFGAADRFESTLSKSIHKRPSVLILKMRHVSMIDVTGVSNLSTLVKNFIKHNGTVMVTELNETSLDMLKRSGLYDTIGSQNFFSDTTEAFNRALDLINTKKCPVCSNGDKERCRVFKKLITDRDES